MSDLVCAWCGKILKVGIDTDGDSHGICKKCLKVQERKIKKWMKKKENPTQY